MAHVAFQPNGFFLVGREMFSIMATETAGPFFMSQVVGMRGPIQFLIGVMDLGIQLLQGLDGFLNFGRVLGVKSRIGLFVELFQVADGLFSFVFALVFGCENFDAFFLDFGNGGINCLVAQRGVKRLIGRYVRVRDTIMAIDTIHLAGGQAGELIGCHGMFKIGVDGFGAIGIGDLDPRNVLLQLVRVFEFDLVFDVPVNAAA